MPDDFVIARNPDGDSQLPYLLRVPLGEHGVILKARDSWPRTAKVYCHRVDGWPADAEVLERVPVSSCVRRGAAIDLVLDRRRENRSQLVMTRIRGGRQVIFWQTARTAKQARPAVPIVFCETRSLAQEWTYRFLAAAAVALDEEYGGDLVVAGLAAAEPLPPAPPTPADVRARAAAHGYPVAERGRVRRELVEAFQVAHGA